MKKILGISILLLLMLSLTVPFALAQNDNATISENGEPEPTVIQNILGKIGAVIPMSFVIAFVTVILGYLRNTPPEKFEVVKFLGTLVFAILMGLITTLAGWDYATAEAWLGQAGLTIWAYWLAKVIAVKLEWAPKSP